MYTYKGRQYQSKPFIINTGDQEVIVNLDNIPNTKVRDVNFSIKAYPRPNRETQQIYINGAYYMSFPSRLANGQDPNNILGSQAVELITYLYERGVNLNDIKKELDRVVNKNIKRRLVNPRFIHAKRLREYKKLDDKLNNFLRAY